MKIDLKKYTPPGMDLSQEKGLFIAGMCGSTVYSLFFFGRYWDAYEALWKWQEEPKVLWPGAEMEPFLELLDKSLVGYLILAICMFGMVAAHYGYYRQGSKSIYLMRRLPDGKLLRRTCWTLPMVGVALCLAAAAVSLLLFYTVYITCTPPECLPR